MAQKGKSNPIVDRHERYQVRFLRSWKAYNRGDLAAFIKSTATELCKDIDEKVGGPFAEMVGPVSAIVQASEPGPTVSIGDSKDHVLEAFGRPNKILNDGEAVVYLYKDVKVTFDADGAIVAGVEVR